MKETYVDKAHADVISLTDGGTLHHFSLNREKVNLEECMVG
jgi:hypothetical protein